MPFDKVSARLHDILREIALAQEFVGTLTSQELEADDLRLHATVRCLEIISEASRRLPDDLKSRHPEIPWRLIAGAGNIYRHDYDDVLPGLIWGTVRDFLPALREAVVQELGSTGS